MQLTDNFKSNWIGLFTIVNKEFRRIFRIWIQTLLPPVVTTMLYFMIFGHVIGHRIGKMDGFPYIQYIAPGLIMLSVINSSYSATVSSFFSAKFQRSIEELLVSPLNNFIILCGYMLGGMLRGILVGGSVAIVAVFFTKLHVHSWFEILTVGILTSAVFSLGGMINAIYATKFDDISIIPTFILAPLTYLGGVFYSLALLPPFWHTISLGNPIVYMVNAFRYGFLGISGRYVITAYVVIILCFIMLFFLALHLLKRSVGLRH